MCMKRGVARQCNWIFLIDNEGITIAHSDETQISGHQVRNRCVVENHFPHVSGPAKISWRVSLPISKLNISDFFTIRLHFDCWLGTHHPASCGVIYPVLSASIADSWNEFFSTIVYI